MLEPIRISKTAHHSNMSTERYRPMVKNFDEGKINLSIFLDLKKAFDTVDHKTLLLKLRKYGIESISYNWFASYPTNVEQFCYFDGANSGRRILKRGILQVVFGTLAMLIIH